MSREILGGSVRQRGYISKIDGVCWRHTFQPTGEWYSTNRVQNGFPTYSANCNQAPAYANALGAHRPPGPLNGFEVIRGVGFCDNYPESMIVRVLRGSNYYKASPFTIPDGSNTVAWIMDEIDPDDVEAICGEEIDITIIDPNAPEPPPPPIGSTGTDNFINQSIPIHIQYGVGAAIALAALLYFNFKK